MSSRRQFVRTVAVGFAGVAAACRPASQPSASQVGSTTARGSSRALLVKNPDHPAPSTLDRLPLDWHKQRARLLQERAGAKGADVIWLSDPQNVQYFTGLFATTTERPAGAFIAVKELKVWFYYPGLDRDLVDAWWNDGFEYYFDFKHAEGGFPNRDEVKIGPPVDLTRWMLRGMAARGFGKATFGVDRPLTVTGLASYQQALPGARFLDMDDECMGMRMVKTAEEIALTQRAMNYGALGHAFARDYLLEHGTECTDWEIQCATQRYVVDEMMKDIKRDGRPHTAVGCGAEVMVRTGVGTAYPHPNQFHHNRVKKGDALQVVCIPLVGGYNGEQYRSYQIAP